MTVFQIIEAREYHCGQIIRRLRAEHREALVGFGVHAHGEIRKNFDMSAFRRAWLIDGRLGAVFGITGSVMASQGYGWLAISEEGTKYPIEIAKETRRQFAAIMTTKHDVITTLLPEDKTALRYAHWIGFEQMHTTPVPFGNGRVIAMRYRGRSLARAA